MLFNTIDRAVYKNKMVYSKIIEELWYLQTNRIEIIYRKKAIRIYFLLSQIIGDNQILGFVSCFRANHPCRLCLSHRKVMATTWTDDNCVFRTIENYKYAVEHIDATTTGVVEECVFNKLENYHVVDNRALDVMHDLLEGICQYDLALFL